MKPFKSIGADLIGWRKCGIEYGILAANPCNDEL
jgi:hypothetical protein